MFASPDLAKFLGPAMGVVFQAPGHKTLYLVGDTIWRDEIDQNLKQHEPKIVVINAGYAMLNDYYGSIIMGKEDVLPAAPAAPNATIVATHMTEIKHMAQLRKELREYQQEKTNKQRVYMHEEGETVNL